MISSPTKKVLPEVDPDRIHPLRDGILAALGVLLCLSASAWWIHHQTWETMMSHHEETVRNIARRVATIVDPTVLVVQSSLPESQESLQALMEDLTAIDKECAPVGRVTVLKEVDGVYRILYDTGDPRNQMGWKEPRNAQRVPSHEAGIVAEVLKTGEQRDVGQTDGTMKSYVPIGTQSNRVQAVATAESTRQTLWEGFAAIGRAVWSAVLLGAGLALLICAVVCSIRRRTLRALQKLVRTERADRLVLNAMGQVFYEWDEATDEIRWRGDLENLLGEYPTSVTTGAAWIERIHKADRDEFLSLRKTRAEADGHFRIEYRVHRPDGGWIWVLDRGRCLPEEKNHSAQSIGVILNMTASREAGQRLRDVVDAAGEYIWEVNADSRFTYLSGRVKEVLGRTPEEMLGTELFDYVPSEDVEKLSQTWTTLLGQQQAFRDFEHRILRVDGKIIWLRINGVPAFDANGAWSGYRGAGLEITDRKEAEQALIQEKEAANAAVRAKSQFLAMMSHEIRTPLNSVLGFADLLSATSLDREQQEQVNLIRKSGDALLVLLNDILDFSRIESDALTLDVTEVDLRTSLQDAVDLYRLAAHQRAIDLSLEVGPGVPRFLRTDQARLRQILLNLVGNAIKFTEKGSVTVRAIVQEKLTPGCAAIRIEVEDTGVGIPSDKISSLFQPFVQVDASATRRFGGTGLGLAICRRLAKLLGGEVGLQRSDETGSIFFLTLNAEVSDGDEPVEAGDATLPESKSRPAVSAQRRILVAEDNKVNRLLVRKMLASFGLTSEEAENGLVCLQMQTAEPFDLILMDVQMPVLDGLEAARVIRRNEQARPDGKRTTIVALTADAMVGDRERCLAAGMDDYLTKPIRMETMSTMLIRHQVIARQGPDAQSSENDPT